MERTRVIHSSYEYESYRDPCFYYLGKGPSIHLIQGKLYTRRKDRFPTAYTSDDNESIDGLFAKFWEWMGSPPFIYTGEVIREKVTDSFYNQSGLVSFIMTTKSG